MKKALIPLLIFILTACSIQAVPGGGPAASPTPPAPSQTPGVPLPPVEGPDPSYKVAAFYYPWYGNPAVDGEVNALLNT